MLALCAMSIPRYCLVLVAVILGGCTTTEQSRSSAQTAELRAIPALHIEEEIMEMVRLTKDWEDAQFRTYKQQDIDGDGVDDTILLTTFEYDNNSRQMLFVCLSSYPQKVMSLNVGGGKGDRIAEEIDIKERTLTISGKKHTVGDAMCCPSLRYESTFAVADGKLVQ